MSMSVRRWTWAVNPKSVSMEKRLSYTSVCPTATTSYSTSNFLITVLHRSSFNSLQNAVTISDTIVASSRVDTSSA